MLFKLLFLCVLVFVDTAYEGDSCSANGNTGTCTVISKCKSAIEDLKNRKKPQICGFQGSESIVCCFDPHIATTTRRSVQTTTMEYVPPVYDCEEDNQDGECEPIHALLTSEKTGQKAFDKCIEYQEKYVFPCERKVSLTGGMRRANKCQHNAEELLLGGGDALRHEFPHTVMLGYGDDPQSLSWLCGGTLISERFILTEDTASPLTLARCPLTYVLVGALTRQDAQNETNRYRVKRGIQHPGYTPPSKYNDIGLIETENPINLSEYVVPACLHVGDPVADDQLVWSTAWGLTEYKGTKTEIMQKIILRKFSTDECSLKYPVHRLMKIGFDPDTQTCYGNRTEVKDTCQSDSGGPIHIKSNKINCMYVTVGVTSFGKACRFPVEPVIYTRVDHYVPWIESVVWP